MRTDTAVKFPLFWGHGTSDPVVPYEWGKKSTEFLKLDLKMDKVSFHSYPGTLSFFKYEI